MIEKFVLWWLRRRGNKVPHGCVMISLFGEKWLFVDQFGDVYVVRPTYREGPPLEMWMLERR